MNGSVPFLGVFPLRNRLCPCQIPEKKKTLSETNCNRERFRKKLFKSDTRKGLLPVTLLKISSVGSGRPACTIRLSPLKKEKNAVFGVFFYQIQVIFCHQGPVPMRT